MKFRLAAVGHRDTLQTVGKIVEEYFDDVDVLTVEFGTDDTIDEAAERIAQVQSRCDGILYSRKDPYLLISRRLHHVVPVRYVDMDGSDLLIALLKAVIEYGGVPEDVSIDSFDPVTVREAFKSVGIGSGGAVGTGSGSGGAIGIGSGGMARSGSGSGGRARAGGAVRDGSGSGSAGRARAGSAVREGSGNGDIVIRHVTAEAARPGFVKAILQQHVSNYNDGARLCITNVTDVYRSLRAQGVAAALTSPSEQAFVREIRNLLLRRRLSRQAVGPVTVMHIHLKYKERHRFSGKMPIREVDDVAGAAKLIAIFAEELDGAMYDVSRRDFVLVCNRPLPGVDADHFVGLDLIHDINGTTPFDVTIAVGSGRTIREAEANAWSAANEASAYPGSHAFVMPASGRLFGPLRPKSEHFPKESTTETRLADIAEATGIGLPMLHELHKAMRMHNTKLFTSARLAETLDVSPRTANRLVRRLLDHRFAAIEGKDLSQTEGRPARIIRFLF